MTRRNGNGNGNGVVAELAPMKLEECPVHGSLVLITHEGRFIRRCPGCIAEAERGMRILAEIAERKRLEGNS